MIATGKITTFPGQSKYQIVIEQIEPAGAGALMALLEERRKKLAAKACSTRTAKSLPTLPASSASSPRHRRGDPRYPAPVCGPLSVQVLVWPVRVQGEGAPRKSPPAFAASMRLPPGAIPRPDLLIVARGGGSLEDLWALQRGNVVRAAATAHIR